MAKFQGKKENGKLVISKGYEKLTEENSELANELDYITKEELIDAIKLLADEISQLKGESIEIQFTYDNNKNKL